MSAHPSTHEASGSRFPDAVLVPRPDHDAYRLRWVANAAVAVGGVGLVLFAVLSDGDGSQRLGALLAGLIAVPFAVWATQWQRGTWLDPEPALVLTPSRFRLRHKGEHLWVPWTDVADLEVAVRGSGPGRSRLLLFRLRPDATTVLPQQRATLAERSLAWHTDDLAYSRPHEVPAFPEVVRVAAGLWATANGIPLEASDDRS